MCKINFSILILALLCLVNISSTKHVSTDGSCGPDKDTVCPDGFCCSRYGYCGNTPDFCNQGCQQDFGTCSPNSTQNVSADGTCGPDKNTVCPNGYCCSKYCYCGNTPAFCDIDQGCQPGYGTCGQNSTAQNSTAQNSSAQNQTVSINGSCGPATNTVCAAGYCCSKYGYCGNTT
ncbi:11676_t:CDS:2, partial [Dentiscutata erythropus]